VAVRDGCAGFSPKVSIGASVAWPGPSIPAQHKAILLSIAFSREVDAGSR
jgi:hypothetical protein